MINYLIILIILNIIALFFFKNYVFNIENRSVAEILTKLKLRNFYYTFIVIFIYIFSTIGIYLYLRIVYFNKKFIFITVSIDFFELMMLISINYIFFITILQLFFNREILRIHYYLYKYQIYKEILNTKKNIIYKLLHDYADFIFYIKIGILIVAILYDFYHHTICAIPNVLIGFLLVESFTKFVNFFYTKNCLMDAYIHEHIYYNVNQFSEHKMFQYIKNNFKTDYLFMKDSNFVLKRQKNNRFIIIFCLSITYLYFIQNCNNILITIKIIDLQLPRTILLIFVLLTIYCHYKVTTKLNNNFNYSLTFKTFFWFLVTIQVIFYSLVFFKNRLLALSDEILWSFGIEIIQIFSYKMKCQYVFEYFNYILETYKINNLNPYSIINKYGNQLDFTRSLPLLREQIKFIVQLYLADTLKTSMLYYSNHLSSSHFLLKTTCNFLILYTILFKTMPLFEFLHILKIAIPLYKNVFYGSFKIINSFTANTIYRILIWSLEYMSKKPWYDRYFAFQARLHKLDIYKVFANSKGIVQMVLTPIFKTIIKPTIKRIFEKLFNR